MTNEVIYKSNYSGNYSETPGGGYHKTWANIMNKTADKLMEDMIFDEDLTEALQEYLDR
ncbi:MAG: hypothetical protein K6L75_01140 [Cellvibrionaceae bacterium]